MVKKCCYFYLYLLMIFMGTNPVLAQKADKGTDTLSQYDDCSDNDIDYENSGTPLTIDEKITRMDTAFYASLNKFDRCQTENDSSASSNAAGGASSSRDSSSNSGKIRGTDGSGAKSSPAAVASAAVSGVAPPPPPQGAKSQPEQQQTRKSGKTSGGTPTTQLSANGKAPDDIPPGDNDSILEAQIRAAATAEADPARKKLLWNEYRRYKGLKIIK